MRTILFGGFLAISWLLLLSGLVVAEEPSKNLLTYHKEKAFRGFTLYAIEGNAQVHLLNMNGDVVHRWDIDAERARLLPNGNLLVTHGSNWGKGLKPWKNLRHIIREYSWDGEVVWEYKSEDTVARYFERLQNGNTVFLQRAFIPSAHIVKNLGERAPKKRIRGDEIVEIDSSGNRVWSWLAYRHLDLMDCGKRVCSWAKVEPPARDRDDWTHGNTSSVLPPNKWYDAGDTRFKPGNILYMPRNFSQLLLIERDSGKVTWRYDGDYKGGIGGGHEAIMIEPGLPGAGNILMFDNWSAEYPKQSHPIEFNPVTKELVWVFDAGEKLYSETSGACQRLANGNTLISEDNASRVLEVTTSGDIVWEYKDPSAREINRAQRYPPDYAPQFASLKLE